MNRFYTEEFLNEFLDTLSDIDEKYLINMRGTTKSMLFTELRSVLGGSQTRTFSKCYKELDNLCDDLGAKSGMKVRYSKHSSWIWFNFYGEFDGYAEQRKAKSKEAYLEYQRVKEEKLKVEREMFSASIKDGTYGIISKDKGGVYLLSCGDFYKIGLSKDINSRLSGIRTSNPLPVELVAKYSSFDRDYLRLEKHLHEKFKDSRHLLEWFKKDFTKEEFLAACIEFCKSK
jgi:hypothetical protein